MGFNLVGGYICPVSLVCPSCPPYAPLCLPYDPNISSYVPLYAPIPHTSSSSLCMYDHPSVPICLLLCSCYIPSLCSLLCIMIILCLLWPLPMFSPLAFYAPSLYPCYVSMHCAMPLCTSYTLPMPLPMFPYVPHMPQFWWAKAPNQSANSNYCTAKLINICLCSPPQPITL